MKFNLSIEIERSPSDVFAFFRDIYKLPFHNHPIVPVYEKVTPGPVNVETGFSEVINMLPGIHLKIRSELTAFQPDRFLEYRWTGPGMHGELSYTIEPASSGTHLIQQQTLNLAGILAIFNPLMGHLFSVQIARRLESIKAILEGRARFGETIIK